MKKYDEQNEDTGKWTGEIPAIESLENHSFGVSKKILFAVGLTSQLLPRYAKYTEEEVMAFPDMLYYSSPTHFSASC